MPQEDGWAAIDTAPEGTWIQMYSPNYHRGPGLGKNGIMIGRCTRDQETGRMQYFDDFGIRIFWKFTQWKPLSDAPTEL